MNSRTNSPGHEWRDHWPVVLAGAAGMALAGAPAYSTGVMLRPLQQAFGWSRAAITTGPLIVSVVAVFASPLIGVAVDRFGPRRIGTVGAFVACATLGLLSLATRNIWSWWMLWGVLAVVTLLVKPMIWTAGVSSLFDRGRGLALAVVLCGGAIASSVTPLASSLLVDRFGWRGAYIGLAVICAVLYAPLILVFFGAAADRRRPGPAGLHPPGLAARKALLSWKFFRMALAALFMTLAGGGLVLSLVPILISTGQPKTAAAGLAALVGLSTIAGRLTSGHLLDRMNGNLVVAVSAALPGVSCALLLAAPGSAPVAVAAVLVLGLSLGAELDGLAYLTTRHFGLLSYGVLFGAINGLISLATGVGPLLLNRVYDLTRSYNLALWVLIPTGLVAAALLASLGPYPSFASARTAEENDLGAVVL